MTEQEIEARLPAMRQHLLRIARARIADKASAEDLVQEALLRVWLTRERIQGDPTAWSVTILRNVAAHDWRGSRWGKDLPLEDARTGQPVELPVPANQDTAAEAGAAVRAIEALPDGRRQLFVEVAVMGASLEDAAARHGLPVGTVKSRNARTAARLRTALDGRIVPSWQRKRAA